MMVIAMMHSVLLSPLTSNLEAEIAEIERDDKACNLSAQLKIAFVGTVSTRELWESSGGS